MDARKTRSDSAAAAASALQNANEEIQLPEGVELRNVAEVTIWRQFTRAHAALVFALNFASDCYDRPVMNRLADGPRAAGKGLAGLDGAAQAGMVRAEAEASGRA